MGLEGFLFGDKGVGTGLLSNVATSNGGHPDVNGLPAKRAAVRAGYTVMAASKVVPIMGPNPIPASC